MIQNQSGYSLLIVAAAVMTILILGTIAFSTPEIRNILPFPKTELAVSPSPVANYSEKQQLYLRNKAIIQKELQLSDEQFDLLVENANKN